MQRQRQDTRRSQVQAQLHLYFSKLKSPQSLNIDNFTLFTFQASQSNISRYFLLYKYLHALLMLGCVTVNVVPKDIPADFPMQWHVHISHWSTILCTLEAFGGLFVASYFYQTSRSRARRDAVDLSSGARARMIFLVYLNSTAHAFSATATILYWAFMVDTNADSYWMMCEHTMLPPLLIFKLLVERMPLAMSHILYPILLLIGYFVDVTLMYLHVYEGSFWNGKPYKEYVFKNFNDETSIYFILFVFKCCLILSATHVMLVVLFLVKTSICRPRLNGLSRPKALSYKKAARATLHNLRLPEPGRKTGKTASFIKMMSRMESAGRHDYIRTEWSEWSDKSTFLYVTYRFIHMSLFTVVVVISVVEPQRDRNREQRTVNYYCLWIFYMGNFFMMVSLVQSIFGFVIILKSYKAKIEELKYFEKRESYVTVFQKSYSTINSAATSLALFTLCSAGLLVEDTGGSFRKNDYTYDSSHIINALAMFLDFLVVAHPFKMAYGLLSCGLVVLNIVFNYWLYTSLIVSRAGKKYIYRYLFWEEPEKALTRAVILVVMLLGIHVSLWVIFLQKRFLSAFLGRRLLNDQDLTLKRDAFYRRRTALGSSLMTPSTANNTSGFSKTESAATLSIYNTQCSIFGATLSNNIVLAPSNQIPQQSPSPSNNISVSDRTVSSARSGTRWSLSRR